MNKEEKYAKYSDAIEVVIVIVACQVIEQNQ